MNSARADTLGQGTIVSRYRLEHKLGAGQMGEVYAATRQSDGGQFALKIINASGVLLSEPLRRFHREATLCSQLRHPNVVPVVDYGVWNGRPFLAMPILRGRDLDNVLEATGALAPAVAVSIAVACARGLGCAHESQIVHRDFKPANVFLDEANDGTVVPVVCDFGVAKAIDPTDSAITATGSVVGTPLYMSLEQLLDSKRVDARTDVWSLGVTLYQMLCGRTPFAHLNTYAELLLTMKEEKLPALQSFAPWLPPDLARVVHAMLLPADRRIPSMADVVKALTAVQPVIERLDRSMIVALPNEMKRRDQTIATMPRSAEEVLGPGSIIPGPDSAAAPSDPFIGATIADRYRVVYRLGTGGMGAVYEALDSRPVSALHGEVALKLMLAAEDEEGVRRFLREARAAARIASPYVAAVLDTGVDPKSGAPYLAMERLRGNDLAGTIRKFGAIEPGPLVALFLNACEALAAAHALGIVHRDVKPSNLFVHENPDGTVVMKICDFGIAKQLSVIGSAEASVELTRTGGLLGSPLYMSPEQAKSAKHVDGRSDVFSLALSLHEALSGHRPWEGRTSMGEIIVAICTEDAPSLRVVAPWTDPGLVAVVERALKRDPNERQQSIAQFAAELRPFARPAPVRKTDITSVPAERRVSIVGLPPPSMPQSKPISGVITTGNPVSIPMQPPKTNVAAVVLAAILGLAVLAGAGFVAVTRLKPKHADPIPAQATAPPPTAASSNVMPEPAPTTTTASSTPDAEAPKIPITQGGHHPSPQKSATTPGLPPPAPAPTASNVGRGVTATDLPP